MKILILEDNKNRMSHFRAKFFNDDITHVEHAQDAIDELKENAFDLICLDNDLGGTEMDYDPNDCGILVAKWLKENQTNAKIIIHSFNQPAAERMLNLLPQAKYIPGYWLSAHIFGGECES